MGETGGAFVCAKQGYYCRHMFTHFIAKVGPDEELIPWPIVLGIALLATSMIIGVAFAVWNVVRWINRRDDPRHVKRPVDHP